MLGAIVHAPPRRMRRASMRMAHSMKKIALVRSTHHTISVHLPLDRQYSLFLSQYEVRFFFLYFDSHDAFFQLPDAGRM